MKTILLALVLAFGITAAQAQNTFPQIAPGAAAELLAEPEIVTPGAPENTVRKGNGKEIDYSKNPVIHFDQSEWVQIGKNGVEKETYWLNVKSIDSKAENFVMIGMVLYDTDRKIQGIGTEVRRVFSEAVVSCSNRTVYPLRDVYTTVDFHLVSLHRHAVPQGMMFLDDVPMFKEYPSAKTTICPKK